MTEQQHRLTRKVTAILVYGRPCLVFGAMLCAIGIMLNRSSLLYITGVILLFVSMMFDLIDGWFAARFRPHAVLTRLADRVMDKIVYAIIFPLITAGGMWRLTVMTDTYTRAELLHAIFILILCVTVLIRDSFAQFLRGFGIRQGVEPEPAEFTRLRTIVAAPVGMLLYAYAFYVPDGPPSWIYAGISWMGNIPLRGLFFIEIVFLIINFVSIAIYCRKYGAYCLDEICLEDERLRRRILSFFPAALTVMNAVMGLLAVIFVYQGRIREAYLLLIGAAMFDKLDGAVARKLGLTDPLPESVNPSRINMGSLLDDMSDAVSFCIVPAWIFYITFSDFPHPVIQKIPVGWIVLCYALLGFCRLIYFTIDKTPIPGFFKGMPTTAAALLATSSLVIFSQAVEDKSEWIGFWGFFCFALMIFVSIMMNFYPVRYLHLGRFMSRNRKFARLSAFLLIIFVFTPYFGHMAFSYLFLYLLSPLITGHIDPSVAASETPVDN